VNLADWQHGGTYFDWQGHRLFVRRGGSGKPLLLIHGFPTSGFDWAAMWPALSSRYSLHALDMLGFGLSDKPKAFAYSLSASADQWQDYVQSQALPDVEVLAHDYGDTVLQELLARQNDGLLPFRIARVNVLNGGLFPEATFPILMQKLLLGPLGPLVAKLSRFGRFCASMQSIAGKPLRRDELRAHWQLLARANGRVLMPKIIQYIRERRRHRERWTAALQQADIPLQLIIGERDPISGKTIAHRWHVLLPNSPITRLADVGHYPQWEAPERVLAAMQRYSESNNP
jgi:pimeloyl-ACP methyl ester carboxylesterase